MSVALESVAVSPEVLYRESVPAPFVVIRTVFPAAEDEPAVLV